MKRRERRGSGARQWHLVCYDVRDEARLRRVAKVLMGYGDRVQYSVFRCRLSDREVERLRWEMTRVLAKEDAWLIVPVCERCLQGMRAHEGERAWPAEVPSYVVV